MQDILDDYDDDDDYDYEHDECLGGGLIATDEDGRQYVVCEIDESDYEL